MELICTFKPHSTRYHHNSDRNKHRLQSKKNLLFSAPPPNIRSKRKNNPRKSILKNDFVTMHCMQCAEISHPNFEGFGEKTLSASILYPLDAHIPCTVVLKSCVAHPQING